MPEHTPPEYTSLWWCSTCNQVRPYDPVKRHFAWGKICPGAAQEVIYKRETVQPATGTIELTPGQRSVLRASARGALFYVPWRGSNGWFFEYITKDARRIDGTGAARALIDKGFLELYTRDDGKEKVKITDAGHAWLDAHPSEAEEA